MMDGIIKGIIEFFWEKLNMEIEDSAKGAKKPEIGEYYVAYFDILGYKEYFANNQDEVDNLLCSIADSIDLIIDNIKLNNGIYNMFIGKDIIFKVKLFSDNVLIYYQKQENEYLSSFILMSLIESVKAIQLNLICKYNIFIRGGITKGNFAANDNFVFGQALIDVVELESKVAKYPRIVLDNAIIEELKYFGEIVSVHTMNLLQDADKYINGVFKSSSPQELLERIRNSIEVFDKILQISYPSAFNNLNIVNYLRSLLKEVYVSSQQMLNLSVEALENQFEIIKNLYPFIADAARKISTKHVCQEQFRYKNNIDCDETNIYYIDYLKSYNYTTAPILLQIDKEELLLMVRDVFKNYPDVISEIELHLDDEKFKSKRQEILQKHREVVIENINMHKNHDKILEKYFWVLRLHNKSCIASDNNHLVINIKYSVAENTSLPVLEVS